VDDESAVADLTGRRGVENVATGVFAGGISDLGVGYRYLISVSPRMLYVSGPVDLAPDRVIFRAPRSSVDATMFGGDVVIVADHPPGRKRQLIFRGMASASAQRIMEQLEHDRQPVRRVRRPKGATSDKG
jgi:hypothetical protein